MYCKKARISPDHKRSYTESTAMSTTAKARLIRSLAAVQGVSLHAVAKQSGIHPSVFHRVVRGERRSARIDRIIARSLGINLRTIRRLTDEEKKA